MPFYVMMRPKTSTQALMTDSHIDSLNHPFCEQWRPLIESPQTEAQHIVIDDAQNIEQAIQAGCELIHIVGAEVDDGKGSDAKRWTIAPRTLKKLFGQGRAPACFAIAKRPNASSLDQCDRQDLLVLDGIKITGNIGAICRSVAALGPAPIVFTGCDVDPFDRRIIRASRGLIFHLPIISCDVDALIAFCKAKRIKIATTSSHANTSIEWLRTSTDPVALVMGSEKEGASQTLCDAADQHLCIPMQGKVESLNVSVATSLCWYVRQQLAS